jgi:adenosylhomocysteine nucleosidase
MQSRFSASASVILVIFLRTTIAHGQTTAPASPPCDLVMSSFPEELAAIEAIVVPDAAKLKSTSINGIEFKSVDINGRRFVFFLTGMSLVNAAMNTQLAIDHFQPSAVFFSGIAGGIDPALNPGDVVVPAKWHYHSEASYLNEISPGKYAQPGGGPPKYPNFGMIFPDDVTVKRDGMKNWEQMSSFPADEQLLAVGRHAVESLPEMKTGDRVNRVTVGGDGVSGTVFCDNANYRKWVFKVWKADCLDMESAAIAQVCWENKTPMLIVRGLSDLAGGQAGPNEIGQYLKAAADHSARVLAAILQNLDAAR